MLRNACVQEEIRFLISPELIVSRLLAEALCDNEALLAADAEPRDFHDDMIDDAAWSEQIDAWHAAVRPWLAARKLEDPCDLEDGDLLELAASNARPGAYGWEALYADHVDEFEACR